MIKFIFVIIKKKLPTKVCDVFMWYVSVVSFHRACGSGFLPELTVGLGQGFIVFVLCTHSHLGSKCDV